MSLDVVFTTARLSMSPLEREAADAFCDALRGADLDDALFVAGALLDDGDWRPWMLPALLHLHRGRVVELLRRLGPLVTAAHARVDCVTVNARVRRRRPPASAACSPFDC